MPYLLLPEFYYSVLVLILLSILSWFEIKFLRKIFLSKRIVSKVIHVASIHKRPVPYGGGIALVDMFVLALILWLIFLASKVSLPTILGYEFLLALIGICLVSFWDDIKPLPPLPRLLVQMIFVALLLPLLPGSILLNYFPQWFDWLFAFLFWVCFTNFFNFMDGIDGISGVQMGSVGAGLFLVTLFIGNDDIFLTTGLPGLALLCAAIVFLLWNWHPAKIFLGDCGSVPIGFIIAGLILQLSSYGYWEAAVILPLYYYMDAGLTLLKRIIRLEKIWLPHVSHFYHMARISGYPHNVISRAILLNNCLLILLAILSIYYEFISLLGAFCSTSLLLFWMFRGKQTSVKPTK
ncbi:MAG: UDP-N-acetylmuramyl pentapeptide phosphotransferase [Alphaproteobacteria bacterium]|nr:UDP-N-acetylmuramyl pentapeptide phosphotransferase [Alphaproteobacteria bacterium]